MAKETFDKSFYSTKQWQSCRELCLQRAGGLCERCAKEGRITAAVIAHHKIPVTAANVNDPSIVFNLDNLEALCIDCHAAVHRKGKGKRYKVDAAGRVIPRI